jgi:hypothetical protein
MRNSWSRNLLWGFSAALLLTVLTGCKSDSHGQQQATQPLAISGTPTPQLDPGQSYHFVPTVTADTSDSTALKFSVQNRPAWMAFNAATGEISGTPSSSDIGDYVNILISVAKGTSSASLPAFSVTVVPPNNSGGNTTGGGTGSSGGGSTGGGTTGGTASLSWIAPTTNSDGTPLTDLAGYRIYYGLSHSAMINVITITNTQLTNYQVTGLVPAVWYFEVKAYNSANVESDRSPIVSKTI